MSCGNFGLKLLTGCISLCSSSAAPKIQFSPIKPRVLNNLRVSKPVCIPGSTTKDRAMLESAHEAGVLQQTSSTYLDRTVVPNLECLLGTKTRKLVECN